MPDEKSANDGKNPQAAQAAKNGATQHAEPAAKNEASQHAEPTLAALKSKLSEYENDVKRIQAEFENYKKRAEKERGDLFSRMKLDGVKEFLVLADELESAAAHAKAANPKQLARGLELLSEKCKSILKANHVEEIRAEGKLDPAVHDVLMAQGGGEEGKIAYVLRKGYKCGDVVLRHAQVAVYNGNREDEKKEEKKNEGEKNQNEDAKENENAPKNENKNAKENANITAKENENKNADENENKLK